MDDFMKDVDSLFAMAGKAAKAPPLVASEVMKRIDSLAPSVVVPPSAPAFELPVRFMVVLGSTAAAVAVVFAALSWSVWQGLNDPFALTRFLPDVLNLLKV